MHRKIILFKKIMSLLDSSDPNIKLIGRELFFKNYKSIHKCIRKYNTHCVFEKVSYKKKVYYTYIIDKTSRDNNYRFWLDNNRVMNAFFAGSAYYVLQNIIKYITNDKISKR